MVNQYIQDPHLRVVYDIDGSSPNPQRSIWRGQHQCVIEGFSPDDTPPETDRAGSIVIRHQLQGDRGHYSVLDQAFVLIHCAGFPHSVVSQITRHTGSRFLVQCLTGDTELTFVNRKGHNATARHKYRTIGELFNFWENGGGGVQNPKTAKARIKKFRLRCLDEVSGEFTHGHIKEIYETGIQPVYRVTLENGYQVKATVNHRFMTRGGWQTLKDLAGLVTDPFTGRIVEHSGAGIELMTNGKTVGEGLYQTKEWLEECLAAGLTTRQMAEAAGCSMEAIKKWVYRHGLKLNQAPARPSWNKGMGGKGLYKITLTPARREADRQRGLKRRGENSDLWKGGITPERKMIANWQQTQKPELMKKYGDRCAYCGATDKLEIDHVLPVRTHPHLAYSFDNLQILCRSCHKSKSNWENRIVPDWSAIESIEFCGFQPTYDIEMEGRNPSFIANGFVVHNSGRYTGRRISDLAIAIGERGFEGAKALIDETFYLRPPGNYTDREGKRYEYTETDRDQDLFLIATLVAHYGERIERGFSEEHARGMIPYDLRQNFCMSGTVKNFFHWLDQRSKRDAQLEIQTLAWMAFQAVKPHMPELADWYYSTRWGRARLAP